MLTNRGLAFVDTCAAEWELAAGVHFQDQWRAQKEYEQAHQHSLESGKVGAAQLSLQPPKTEGWFIEACNALR